MTAISLPQTRTTPRRQVAAAAETTTTWVETGPNYASIYASSIFAVSMLFLFGVAVPCAMAYGSATGWGLGAFCALWGGPGFGVMVASARVSMWHEKHETHA